MSRLGRWVATGVVAVRARARFLILFLFLFFSSVSLPAHGV